MHTPGPWITGPGRRGIAIVCVKPDYAEQKLVATVNAEDLPVELADENATLIAAAPDLLAALKEMTPELYGCFPSRPGGRRHSFITDPECVNCQKAERARMAIVKAEGR